MARGIGSSCGSRRWAEAGKHTSATCQIIPRTKITLTTTEIAPNVFRISIFGSVANIQFNHFLIQDEEPLLSHTCFRRMFPEVRDAVSKLINLSDLKHHQRVQVWIPLLSRSCNLRLFICIGRDRIRRSLRFQCICDRASFIQRFWGMRVNFADSSRHKKL
jgi:hypothetical protein